VLGSVYTAAHIPVAPRLRAEAALMLTPDAVLSHHTALALWIAEGSAGDDVHVSVQRDPHRSLPRVKGLRVHEVRKLEHLTHAGLPVTPPRRTFLDLAPYCDLTELVTSGDSLVRRTDVDPEHLIEAASASISVRGIRLAREAAGLVRRGVDSPMESRLRLLLVLAGLPEPEVGRVIHDSDGGWLARPDLCYPDLKIAIEYDSYVHHLGRDALVRDGMRRNKIVALGWLPITATANDVKNGGQQIADDLRRARALRTCAEVGE
jgi:hypothetical protein